MLKFRTYILVAMLSFPFESVAQKDSSLVHKLDSLKRKTDTTGQVNITNPAAYNEQTRLTGKTYFLLLWSDIKQSYTKPFHMHGKDWRNLGLFAGAAALLSFADKPIQQNAVEFSDRNANVHSIGEFISRFGSTYEVYTLAAFETYGLLFKSTKVKTTTLLATQAVITGTLIFSTIKTLAVRVRPNSYAPDQIAEPVFKGPFSNTSKDFAGHRSNSSFPSGHTTVSFAAATVFAMEYKNKPLIPIIAYSISTLIALSRITENKHWTTDVLAGAAIGYLTGRHVVNNYHRYSKIQSGQKKNTLSWNLNYYDGHVSPGIVYHLVK